MKCKTCGQDRPFVPVVLSDNALSFIEFENEKCKECGRLPEEIKKRRN